MTNRTKIIIVLIAILVAFAGIFVYKNKYEKNIKTSGTSKSKETVEVKKDITQEEAIQIAQEFVSSIGKDFGTVESAELIEILNKTRWQIRTDKKLDISIDSKTGKMFSYFDTSIDDSKIASKLNKNQVEQKIRQKYNELGYKDDEYKLTKLQRNVYNNWQADFCKEYDGIYNQYQCIRISIIPEVDHLNCLVIFDEEFENNPVEISKENATEVAKSKAKELRKDDSIKEITTTLEIKEANGFFKTDESVERKVRKVWNVKIEYKNDMYEDIDEYYIDCTTGKIIGGDTVK